MINIANVILLLKYIQLMCIVIFFGRHFSKKLINSFRVSKDVIWTISNLFISRTNVSFWPPLFSGGTTPTSLRQIVSANYHSLFGKVWLSSVY